MTIDRFVSQVTDRASSYPKPIVLHKGVHQSFTFPGVFRIAVTV
jgi:hypothetical protein